MNDEVGFDGKAFLATVSSMPGVYRMIDRHDKVIYVGKAKNLKKRAEVLVAANVDEEDATEIQDLVKQARAAVTDQDWDKVKTLNQNLSDVLFDLED